ncbi:battenin family protein [Kitasatospora sp. NBC_01287]|uniref:hypothetical protein n=1 Tax=Kitasatospora sp. NBC_01287 TaxID=2903573 RepID=UPI002257B8C4|nr:hypothetical protein [Kitasatospora sp. NBC_01287]MCX4750315.1 battenin family protein [Kitasatospora sp. NBC_01287]
MGQDWFGLIAGSGLVVIGVRTLSGWHAHAYKRPRVGGWSSVTGGVGIAGGALLALTGSFGRMGEAGWLPIGLVFAGFALFISSGPATKVGRQRRG